MLERFVRCLELADKLRSWGVPRSFELPFRRHALRIEGHGQVSSRTGFVRVMLAAALASGVAFAPPASHAANDYPTSAVADYVFVCMKVNGDTKDALQQCSCAIDVISSLVPYEQFVEAETVKRMSQLPGDKGSMFRDTSPARKFVTSLRQAEIEAEIRCF
jgi:hypothetical protein